jgi:hypothetical protein
MRTAPLPMQFDYEEGNILNAGLLITQGQTPYPAPGSWPIVLNPYGPVAYLVTAAMVKCFGISFLAPRLVSVFCGLFITFVLGAMIRRSGGSWSSVVLFAGAFLCVSSIRNWLLTCRVDWLALALSLGGLAVFMFWERRWYVASVLFAAALFVKYTLIAAPLACGLYLVMRRDWKLLAKIVGVSSAVCVIGFFATQRWSGGNFAFHTFGTHPDPYSFQQAGDFLWRRIKDIPVLFGLSVAAVILDFAKRKISLPVLYFLAATLGTLTAGKGGSTTNHLIEWTATICLCAGCGSVTISAWLAGKRFALAGSMVTAGIVASAVTAMLAYRLPFSRSTLCEPTYGYLREHGDSILTDSVGALLLSGKPVLVSNPFVYTQLAARGGWPDTEVRERVEAKKFDMILLREKMEVYPADERFTGATLDAMKRNYHEAATFACYDSRFAYLPNP